MAMALSIHLPFDSSTSTMLQVMMQHKIDAIKRIMEIAENIALAHKYDKNMGHRLKAGSFSYNNAKKLNVLDEDDDAGGDEYSRYLSQYRDKDDEHYRVGVAPCAIE